MENLVQPTLGNKLFMAAVAVTAWFGVIMQYSLHAVSTANLLSYFTILTNLLIAVSLTITLLAPASGLGRITGSVSYQTAIGLYIFVVAVVYNTVLRGLVKLEGMGLFVDTVLHVIVPILYLLYWLIFVAKGKLHWRDGLLWLWFPLLYLLYSMIRGSIVGWYPYPFLNPTKQGYQQVFINVIVVILVFLIGGLVMIAINRSAKKAQV